MNFMTNYKMTLFELSLEALKRLAIDIKAQRDSGLMSNQEALDKINLINSVISIREEKEIPDSDTYIL